MVVQGALGIQYLVACGFWFQDKAKDGQLEGILNILEKSLHPIPPLGMLVRWEQHF